MLTFLIINNTILNKLSPSKITELKNESASTLTHGTNQKKKSQRGLSASLDEK